MIKDLIKMANALDSMGLKREADSVDNLIRKVAGGDPRSEREAAIMRKLKEIEPNFNEPRESLPLEERARLKNIEEQVKHWNNFYVSEGSEYNEGDQYGIKLDRLKEFVTRKDCFNHAYDGLHYTMKLRKHLIEDLKKEEKEKHDKEIEGSKPRYDYNMRTDSNTPSWFKGELGGKDLQMGGMSLDDEGEWGYSDEGEEGLGDMENEFDVESDDTDATPRYTANPEQALVSKMKASEILSNMDDKKFEALRRSHPEAMNSLFGPGSLTEVRRKQSAIINNLIQKIARSR